MPFTCFRACRLLKDNRTRQGDCVMWVIYTILALVWTMTLLDVFVPDWQKW